jgi:hypothetical protein
MDTQNLGRFTEAELIIRHCATLTQFLGQCKYF